ncbi:hypothetical protein B566_EDAN005255 [Ephemera danica]|nr:hypothetical protein B566_EDAN005255 [Ephemera danica]
MFIPPQIVTKPKLKQVVTVVRLVTLITLTPNTCKKMTHLQPKRERKTDDKSFCKTLLPIKLEHDTKHSLSFAVPSLDIKPCQRLTTGCDKLNSALCGGLPVGRLIELSGQSGCGKTQLCLQLSLTAQWPADCAGLDAGVLYISTLEFFPSKRLQQLIKCFPIPMKSKPNYGDNIFIERVSDVDALWQCVSKRAPQLMSHRTIRLLIVDSVAGVFRTHLEGGLSNRAKELRNLAKQLMKLSVEHNAAVICVNQVAEVPCNEEEEKYGVREVPALGLSWANLMHTRLRMSKDQSGSRHLEALSSNEIPYGMKCPYQILSHGLFGS